MFEDCVTPDSCAARALMGDLHDAGRSAAKVLIDTRHPEVFSEFKSSTGKYQSH